MYYYYYYAVRRPLSREYGIAVPAFASHAALSLALTFFFFFLVPCLFLCPIIFLLHHAFFLCYS